MPSFASKLCVLALMSASTLGILPSATAQDFSTKPITLVVGFPAGGSNDIVARLIAPHLSEALKTSVIIEIKAGASGTIAAGAVVRAAPDGHTLLVSSLSPTVLTPQTMRRPPYDPRVDLIPINMLGYTPETIAVGPTLPNVKTLADLIALAQTREITMSSAGVGGFPHLAIELFTIATKGKFVHVPYKGATPAVADTAAGHVDATMMDTPPLLGLIKDGRLTALAVSSEKRLNVLPDVPTAHETVLGFSAVSWIGLFAPAQTPAAVINRLNEALTITLRKPEVVAQLEKVALPSGLMASSEEFQKFVGAEYIRWGEVLKQAKIELTD
jgi:tripartite-type tricarboxylate transporter receptor subunit TctC